jgi:hypothetical protein
MSFLKNPGINPITGARIKTDTLNGVYGQLKKACAQHHVNKKDKQEHDYTKNKQGSTPKQPSMQSDRKREQELCEKFNKDTSINPVTGRKISKTSKTGMYVALKKLCSKYTQAKRSNNERTQERVPMQVPVRISKITPRPPSTPTIAKRQQLIKAINKAIEPVLNKGDSLKSRIKFHGIMKKYLHDLEPCLHVDKAGALSLYNVSEPDEPVVKFNKRIGSDSVYGVAYMNMGKGFARLLKFSCKIMAGNVPAHKQEIRLYEQMSFYVENDLFPNMPLTYKTLLCKNLCKDPKCPVQTTKSDYHVVINELASEDIQSWFKQARTDSEYTSVIVQLIFAIYAFHGMGVLHNDCHLGNFLIHKIKPGGFWRYRFEGNDIYVPNAGYLLVMWDPGLASPYSFMDWYSDMTRPLSLIRSFGTGKHQIYENLGLKALPQHILTGLVVGVNDIILSHAVDPYTIGRERVVMRAIINSFAAWKTSSLVHVVSAGKGGAAPGLLMNIKPYNLDATLITEIDIFMKKYKVGLKDLCNPLVPMMRHMYDIDNGACVIDPFKFSEIEKTKSLSMRFGMLINMTGRELLLLTKLFLEHYKIPSSTPLRPKSPWYKQ